MKKRNLQQMIGEPGYSRGVDYHRRGKVLDAWMVNGRERVKGIVSGSGQSVYEQTIKLDWSRGGDLLRVDGDCDCPVGWNCKHVTAVLLAILPRIARRMIASAEPEVDRQAVNGHVHTSDLPGDIDVWLRRLEQPADLKPSQEPSPEKLLYVLTAEPGRDARVIPIKARILKSGGFGKNSSEYTATGNLSMPPRFVTFEDVGILQKLQTLRHGYPARYDWPQGEELYAFLREVIATGRACGFSLDGPQLQWGGVRQARPQWQMDGECGQRLALVGEDGTQLDALPFAPPIYIDRSTGECGPVETGLAAEIAAGAVAAPNIPAQAVQAVGERLAVGGLGLPTPADVSLRERRVSASPRLRLFGCPVTLRPHRFGDVHDIVIPVVRPVFDYDGQEVMPDHDGDASVREGDQLVVLRRDVDGETLALERLEEAQDYGARRVGEVDAWNLPRDIGLGDEDFIFPALGGAEGAGSPMFEGLSFAHEMLPALRAEGWGIDIGDSWPFRLYDGPVSFHASADDTGSDWFSLALNLMVDGHEIDLLPVILHLIDQLPLGPDGTLEPGFDLDDFLSVTLVHQQLPDGRRVRLSGETLGPIVRAFIEAHGLNGFHRAEAGRAEALAQALEGCGVPWKGGRELLELGEKLRALASAPEVAPPEALTADLRPYQKAGYGWLKALSETGFGGALADDMGLGKTVQALALLADRHLAEGCDRPSLVVVPTSLVGNWQREAARFAPDLKLLVLHGPDRKRYFDAIPEHHVIVTTYPLVRRDHDVLFAQPYELAILDEAQAVKNPAASIAKRIRDIDARQRIALTGTPMENNLAELWALYDWLVPGLLGQRREFNKAFRTPIEKHGDRSRQNLLSARVRPFLMRRTKQEVAADLPPKTEIDEIVPLDAAQRELYETLRIAVDARVREAIHKKGMEGSRITILDALLKLRQVCCDPELVKLDAARKVTASAKRTRLMALLDELVAEGRKVLVFSQFVAMLKLIEADVKARGWDYAMLTGRTKDRGAQVSKFQETQAPLFLVSLKAGGTGLNLTAADTVILYDPWWNPAVERQAMDRAHRIGQDKPVFVHRMIAEGTVEATIQTMQAKKQALADALFDDAKGGPMTLGEDDIAALFAPVT